MTPTLRLVRETGCWHSLEHLSTNTDEIQKHTNMNSVRVAWFDTACLCMQYAEKGTVPFLWYSYQECMT